MFGNADLLREIPIPTGFDTLDTALGGGVRRGELILLGGAPGIGKTIGALQMARNIVRNDSTMSAFYLSYAHTENHLMNRLLCLESVNPPETDTTNGLRMKDLQDLIAGLGSNDSLQGILKDNHLTAPALARMAEYAERLVALKASRVATRLSAIRDMASRLAQSTLGNVVLFVDHLQKVGIYPERARDEDDLVTIITHDLKDIALTLNIPVVAVAASDREGLKASRLHLANLQGSSALDYECDIALIMNNKFNTMAKDHAAFNPYQAREYRDCVVFTIEKNRASRAMIDLEYHLNADYFCFDTYPGGSGPEASPLPEPVIRPPSADSGTAHAELEYTEQPVINLRKQG